MKLLLLLALHGGAHASTRHKATKNAVDEATTQRLAAEAASASVIKMPGAVAKLFGREEGAEVPAKQAQGPVKQHQDRFKAGSDAPGKVDIYYLQQAHHQSPVLNYDSLELPARRMMGRLPDGVPEVDLVGLQRPDVVLDQLAGAVLLEVVR